MRINAKVREYELKHDDGTANRSRLLEDIIPELLGVPVNLKLTVPRSFYDSLKGFIKEHGLHPKFDVRKILEYGLVEESDVELERLEVERKDYGKEVYSKYAITKFKAYENLTNNKALALGLQFLVLENKSLRRAAYEKGLVNSPESKWTKEKIDDFQKKYVFGNKSAEKDEHGGKTGK
jgi:hypothetical protein